MTVATWNKRKKMLTMSIVMGMYGDSKISKDKSSLVTQLQMGLGSVVRSRQEKMFLGARAHEL